MRIGVAGLGFMGSTHLKGIQTLKNVEVVAVSSADPKALEGDLSGIQGNLGDSGNKFDFSGLKKYADVQDMLRDPDVEGVDLCLPTDMHAKVTIDALRAGKHVLVEKPMALNPADIDAMLEESRRQKKVLMVAQVLRFFPMYKSLKTALESLGTVRSALFRRRCAAPAWSEWLKDRSRSGGGVFDLLIHDVDIAVWLFGMPEAVSATGYESLGEGIDLLDARLEYANGLTVNITGGWHHPKHYPFSMEYTVVADSGTVEYSSAGRAPAIYSASGVQQIEQSGEDGYTEEVRYFAECADSGKHPDYCSPEASARATKLALLLRDAREKNGERVKCQL